ncbi:plasma membrane iron permease [Diutina catenulata]
MAQVFNVTIFFVVLRETLEAVLVMSTLFSFIKRSFKDEREGADNRTYKKLVKQVWIGALLGLFICICIGAGFIGAFYALKNDIWSKSEDLWEGIFCVIAALLITAMGVAMLRISKMQEKWKVKLAQALLKAPEKRSDRWKLSYLSKKYCMFLLPFLTTLREGLEAVVFIGGVGLNQSASAFPLPVVVGLIAGSAVGVLLYYFGNNISLQIFLIVSTSLLYLISAGLFSRGVWFFENYVYSQKTGGDAAENGSGPGTYDISKSVWHVNCCNPLTDHGWDIFNAIFGWQNSATYGSVLSYNLYWLFIIVMLALMLYEEKNGHLPFCKNLTIQQLSPMYYIKGKNKKKLSAAQEEELLARVDNKEELHRILIENERSGNGTHEASEIKESSSVEKQTASTEVAVETSGSK